MPKPAEWKIKVTLTWCYDMWAEICGDYIYNGGVYQYGKVKRGEKEMQTIFRVARAKGYYEKLKNKIVKTCNKNDITLEEIRATNRVSRLVFGSDMVTKADLSI